MTQKEKINALKETIEYLYCKEGRSKSYISKLLVVNRKVLIEQINKWNLKQANISYLTPSNRKFANKHAKYIKAKLDHDVSIKHIAKELDVTPDYLSNIINKTDVLLKAKEDYLNRLKMQSLKNKEYKFHFENLDGEVWKDILGYDGYYVSNLGRIRKYVSSYNDYRLLHAYPNSRNGRLYVGIMDKNLQVSRLVGFAFVSGYTEEKNTIDHINGDVSDNKASNLCWVFQKQNNKFAYDRGRKVNVSHQANGKFKKIILNDKYEFKTIESLSKFLGKSWTQTNRYISGECKFDGKIKLIY